MQRMVLALLFATIPWTAAAGEDVVVEHARTFQAVAQHVIQLEARNADLEAKVAALELENAALTARVAELESLVASDPPAQNRKQLLLFSDTLVPAVRDEAAAAGAEVCQIFYHWQVDPEKDGTVDLERFAGFLDQMSRDIKWGCIDLEKPYSAWLMGNDDAKRQQAITEMDKAIRLAEEKRPDVAWSFWGIPKLKRTRWTDDEHYAPWSVTPEWWKDYQVKILRSCADLYTNMEWMCPDLYWFRASGAETVERADESHRAWLAVMLAETEQVAGERPVIPAVWHRFYNAEGATHKYMLMNAAEWEKHLSLSLVDGVVWWAGERDKPQMEEVHRERASEAVGLVIGTPP
jgi:hypothetical protein